MKKGICLLIFIGVFSFCNNAISITKEKKLIYMLDVSGSMAGYGNVNTDNVFSKAKMQLIKASQVYGDSCIIEIIPFTHRISSFSNTDTTNIGDIISSINLQKGHSNIEKAWNAGIEALDSSKSNYLFLITDGVHNFGIPPEDLYKKIADFPQTGEEKNCNAYYLVLSEQYRENNIADVFLQNERMFVIDSLINPPGFDITSSQTKNAIIKNISKTSLSNIDTPSAKIPWKIFLWIILIAAILVLLIYFLSFLFNTVTSTSLVSSISPKLLRFISFMDKLPSSLKEMIYNMLPEKKKQLCESIWELKNKYGKQPNIDFKEKPKRFNPHNLTWKEIFEKHGVKRIKYNKNGCPDYSKISKCTIKAPKLYDKYPNFERRGGGNNLQDEVGKIMSKEKGMTIEEFWDYKSKNGLVIHECEDCKTFMLVPKEIHDNINHFGGISVAKQIKNSIA